MIAWLRAASDVPQGRRKLTGLTLALSAAVLVTLGTCGLLLIASGAAAPHIVTVGMTGLGTVAALYGAMVGGNAAEHRHGAALPQPKADAGEVAKEGAA